MACSTLFPLRCHIKRAGRALACWGWASFFLWAIKSPPPSWNLLRQPHTEFWEKKKRKEKKWSSRARGFALTRKMRAGGLNANGKASDVPERHNKPQIPYSWGEFSRDFAHHCVFATRKNNRRNRGGGMEGVWGWGGRAASACMLWIKWCFLRRRGVAGAEFYGLPVGEDQSGLF